MALIGISGKKGHGKDTLAKVFQHLLFEKNYAEGTIPFFATNKNNKLDVFLSWTQEQRDQYSGFIRKMWAEKLKQIVCSIIGCTMEQLEDQSFKEKPLGEEWDLYYIYNMRHDFYYKDFFVTEAEALAQLTQLQTSNDTQEKAAWLDPYETIPVIKRVQMTPRKMLQIMGDAGRRLVHPNIWLNATMVDYKPTIKRHKDSAVRGEDGMWYIPKGHISLPIKDYPMQIQTETFEWDEIQGYPNWIIPDTRFRNECRIIKHFGGILVRIVRPGIDDLSTHESETALDHIPVEMWDGYVTNTGKRWLEILYEQAKAILIKHKLI